MSAKMAPLESLTPWLTGAGARSAEGTNIGHENAEGMAYVGVRVEPTVRLGREAAVLHFTERINFYEFELTQFSLNVV